MLSLITATLLAQAGPGYVPVPQSYTPAHTPFYICVNDRGSYVNLRQAPTTRARSLSKLYAGQGLLIDRRVPVDGWYWAAIKTTDGRTGWVRDDYVCVR